MIVSCVVTRTSLSLADLQLQDTANGYDIDAAGPGSKQWTRGYASSPYVNGEVMVWARQSQASSILRVHVTGSTAAQLESRTVALLAAFEQFSYTLTLTIDGVAHVWACDAADYGPVESSGGGATSGEFDQFELAVFQQTYSFTIPRQPVTTGSM